MKKILLLATAGIMGLAGCATTPPPSVPQAVDQEPLLVGMPLDQRLAKSANTINEQWDLLGKLKQGKRIGVFTMVTHNNEMDARKGDRRTLPQAYAYDPTSTKDINDTLDDTNPASPLSQKIKRIEWKGDSANELGKNFAKAMGYEFATNKNFDMPVSVNVENETLGSAIEKFKTALGPRAQVLVIEKIKTFNIIYK